MFLQQIDDALAATIATKAPGRLAKQLEATRIPKGSAWFTNEFGEKNGAKIASRYAGSTKKTEEQLVKYFIEQGEPGGHIVVNDICKTADFPSATYRERFNKAVCQQMKQTDGLYMLGYRWKLKTPRPTYCL
jgi:hypothetical protein